METRPIESTIKLAIEQASIQALSATASAAIRWGRETFGERLCVLSSMQETTLIDLAMRVDPAIPVVFLDTGYHFSETLETVKRVERRYNIEVEVIPPLAAPIDNVAPGQCCDGKVEQLDAALHQRDAWITGIRRQQTTNRQKAALIDLERKQRERRQEQERAGSDTPAPAGPTGRVKISPLAQWDDHDLAAYRAAHDVIRNPLLDRGYSSIGCRTCTEPTSDPAAAVVASELADARAGRWAGTDRTECGLHL